MRRLFVALLITGAAVAPLQADLKYVMRTTAHPSTVPVPPSTNPMFAMLGGIVIGTIVPPGGIQMTATTSERGTRIEYDQAYLLVPAGAAMLVKPDGSGVIINPAAKTYWKIAKMNAGMMGGALTPDVQVKRTGEGGTVAGVKVDRATIAIRVALPAGSALPGFPAELSVSGDMWLAPEYARYAKLVPAMANGLAALGLDAITSEGFPMRTIVRSEIFAGQEIESVVTSISEVTAPASAFDVPDGYKEVPQPSMPGIGVGR